MSGTWRYSRWNGDQRSTPADAQFLLGLLIDDLAYAGDFASSLRRLLLAGFVNFDGNAVLGIRALRERARARRLEILSAYNVDSIFERIASDLQLVRDFERGALRNRLSVLDGASPDRSEFVERLEQLDLVDGTADLLSFLRKTQLLSLEATHILHRVAGELSRQVFESLLPASPAGNPDALRLATTRLPEFVTELVALKNGLDAARSFPDFADRFSEFIPRGVSDSEALLAAIARRMAASRALLSCMTEEHQAELRACLLVLMADLDTEWIFNELRAVVSQYEIESIEIRHPFTGSAPVTFVDALDLLEQLDQLDRLDDFFGHVIRPGQLAELDLDLLARILGDDAAYSAAQLLVIEEVLRNAGYVEVFEGEMIMTPRAQRSIASAITADIVARINNGMAGERRIVAGKGGESSFETARYETGDLNLDVQRTVMNAIRRAGPHSPIRLEREDFEVKETEGATTVSIALLVDVSLSMEMRGRFLAAKKVALALSSLTSNEYPRDHLEIVAFGREAKRVRLHDLPALTWDFEWGTNIQAALILARHLLSRRRGHRLIYILTDGEPTAHTLPTGEVVFDYPPLDETIVQTLREAAACRASGVEVRLFLFEDNEYLRGFATDLVRVAGGVVYTVDPKDLDTCLVGDFLSWRNFPKA